MKWLHQYPILLIPLGLLAVFLLLPFFGTQKKQSAPQVSGQPAMSDLTGFPDYDLLPERLKQRMEELTQQDSLHRYSFYYFFETDDINRHYFLDDNPMNMIVEAQTVENQEALKLVDEYLMEGRGRGYVTKHHPDLWENTRKRVTKRTSFRKMVVHYIFPEYEAGFRDLRVGIVKDTSYSFAGSQEEGLPDTRTYSLDEVDTLPHPVRGDTYLHEAIKKYLTDQLVYFQFYNMEGVVNAEFTVGNKASSPQIIEGFSTRESEREEAYKLDGLIVKAINDLKVHWHAGWKNGRRVNTRVGMQIYFAFDEQGNPEVSFSELYSANNIF